MFTTKEITPRHYYNHIEYTPWPFYISLWTGSLVFSFLLYINKYDSVTPYCMLFIFFSLFFQIENWNSDIIVESTYLGRYNKKIHSALITGFFLFLTSEIMLFAGFFWAYFDRIFFINIYSDGLTRLAPASHPWISVDWYRLPLLGTILLISSGYLCNLGYYSLKIGFKDISYSALCGGIFLGFLFLLIQEFEYLEFNLTISDGVYASLFFLLTGFHGMHVLVGLLFLSIQTDRMWGNHFCTQRATGLSFSIIYWHFVDIIWLFLFVFVYLFNNKKNIYIVANELENFFFYTLK